MLQVDERAATLSLAITLVMRVAIMLLISEADLDLNGEEKFSTKLSAILLAEQKPAI